MKQIIKLLFCLTIFSTFMTSCGDDVTIPVDQNPSIKIDGAAAGDVTVKPCEEITLPITAKQGSKPLKAIEILENGTKVDISRITWKGSPASANPILLLGTDKSGISAELKVKASCKSGDNTITINIIDDGNVTASTTKKVKTEAIPPTSKYNGPAEITGVTPGGLNALSFDVTKGSGKIVSLEVQENDLKITDLNRLFFDGKKFTANPEALAADYQDGFTGKKVEVRAPNTPGTYKYTFIFTDEANQKTSQTVTLKVGTALTLASPKFGVFWNQSGPKGGGLDLDEGLNTSYTSALAEIVDNGIDSAQTDKAKNWKQTIRGVNGTEIKLLKRSVDVDAAFSLTSSIKFADDIKAVFEKGQSALNKKIVKDDLIVAKKGDKYYIVDVKNVIVTPNDNEDKYEVDILH